MRRWPWLEKPVFRIIVKPWAEEAAHRAVIRMHGSLLGKVHDLIPRPLSHIIGRAKSIASRLAPSESSATESRMPVRAD
jgi:hypothetical protein